MRLFSHLTAIMLALVVLTAALVGVLTHRNLEQLLLPSRLNNLANRAHEGSLELASYTQGARQEVLALAGSQVVGQNQELCADLFGSILAGRPNHLQLRLLDLAGQEQLRLERKAGEILRVPHSRLQDKSSRPYFQEARKLAAGEVAVTGVELNKEQGKIEVPYVPVARFSTPVATGKEPLLLVLNLDMRPVLEQMRRQNLMVVDEAGAFLSHPDPTHEFGRDLESSHRFASEFPDWTGLLGRTGRAYRASSYAMATESLALGSGHRLTVIAWQPAQEFAAPLKAVRRVSLLVAIAAATASLLFGIWLARSITRPISTLARQAEEFGKGARPDFVLGSAPQELSNLARTFQEMAGEVAERARELSRSNQDLRLFAAAASHDLQTPVRSIVINAEWIQRRHGDNLEPAAQERLERIRQSAVRMKRLTEDLTIFTSSAVSPHEVSRVATQDLVAELVQELELHGQVEVAELPLVLGDESQLRRVFANLLTNAHKYCDQEPRIRVGAEPDQGGWRFEVVDNGIGIEPQYQEKVFNPFQRLWADNPRPGSGLGLAIVKRVVERHGGRVWFESEPGKGTTFFFWLPSE
ncbi:MAG: ATP-binding protein [Vulcanimicrobiota bacterium]